MGDPVVIHVLGAFSEQIQLFSVSGHEWKHEPYMSGADLVSTMEFGGHRGHQCLAAWRGRRSERIPGSYLWLNQRPGVSRCRSLGDADGARPRQSGDPAVEQGRRRPHSKRRSRIQRSLYRCPWRLTSLDWIQGKPCGGSDESHVRIPSFVFPARRERRLEVCVSDTVEPVHGNAQSCAHLLAGY